MSTVCISEAFKQQQQQQQHNTADVVVIGAGVAGMTAAVTSKKFGYHTTLVCGPKQLIGGHGNKDENIVDLMGHVKPLTGKELIQNMWQQVIDSQVVLIEDSVASIDILDNNMFKINFKPQQLYTARHFIYTKTIVIATGMTSQVPEHIMNINNVWNKTAFGCLICAGETIGKITDKHVVVVGAGDTAIEDTFALIEHGNRVTMVLRGSNIEHKCTDEHAQKFAVIAKEKPKMLKFCPDTDVMGVFSTNPIIDDGADINKIRVSVQTKGYLSSIICDYILFSFSHIGNAMFLPKVVKRNHTGHILLRPDTYETIVPGIFACGTVTNTKYSHTQAVIGQGCSVIGDVVEYLRNNK
jgi:thioredoxin reductase